LKKLFNAAKYNLKRGKYMKKVFCIITIVFLVLGTLLLEIGPIFPSVVVKNSTAVQPLFEIVILSFVIDGFFYFAAGTVGAVLAVFGKKVVKAVGFGLLFSASFVAIGAFVTVVNAINGQAADTIGTGPWLALIGAILIILAFISDIIGSHISLIPEVNADIHDILIWKDLLDKGIITKDEFDAKKKEILHLDGGSVAPIAGDLKK
jgi:hypothetical protein